MKRCNILVLIALASNGCESSDSSPEFDAAHDDGPDQAPSDVNISGYYLCAIEEQPSTPAFCSSGVVLDAPRLIVVEHDGLVDIGAVSQIQNSAPVWHGTVSANGEVHVTGALGGGATGQITATVNPNSLRDVRIDIVRSTPACMEPFVGVCARGAPQF